VWNVGKLFVGIGWVFVRQLKFIEILVNVEKTLKITKSIISLRFCKFGNDSSFATSGVALVTD